MKNGVATSRPSTAPSTEIAGVIMPSPYSSAAPKRPSAISSGPADGEARPLFGVLARQGRHERGQREDAAFALVVGAQHERDVLDRHHEHQRPEDQRQHAEHVVVRRRHRVRSEEALAHRVERAGADVAVDHAERGQGERKQWNRLGLFPRLLASAGTDEADASVTATDRRTNRTYAESYVELVLRASCRIVQTWVCGSFLECL